MFDVVATSAATIGAQLLSSQSGVVQDSLLPVATLAAPLASTEASFGALIRDYLLAHPTFAMVLGLTLLLWTLIAKGLSLWRAARLKHYVWFVVLFLSNTLSILELAYLLFLSKVDWQALGQKFGFTKLGTSLGDQTKT